MTAKALAFLWKWAVSGKTLTAIAIAGALYEAGKIRRALVAAPTSVVGVWPKELAESAAFPFGVATMIGEKAKRLESLRRLQRDYSGALQVAVINYESTWRDGIFEALRDFDPDLIIADESQRIKTHDAAQSKAMHVLGERARYKLILSGTPVQNAAIDLFSQYKFLDSSVFGPNFYAFRNRYAIMGGFDKHQIIGYKNMDELVRKEYSIAYRVTKEEALDLPETTFEDRIVRLPDKARKIYDTIRRESYAELESGESVTATTVLTRILRLQQLTGGFLRLDETATPEHMHDAKIDALMEIVEDIKASGQKVVVFARFRAEIDRISAELTEKKIRFRVIDGRTPTEHKVDRDFGTEIPSRSEVVEQFQTDPDITVFIAQIQTAGLGITLHAASVAVFYSLDYNYANYQQALARIHRIGQRHPCTYIHLIAENTVDDKVLGALQKKEDLARTVVDNWRSILGE